MAKKNNHPSTPENDIRKRKTFEIIFDNCSSGKRVLDCLDKIADYIEQNDVFDEVIFTIPLQVGTEINRRLFKEFLEAELPKSRKQRMREFHQKNSSRLQVVETDISLDYKLFYARSALQQLHDEHQIDKILEQVEINSDVELSFEELREEFEHFEEQIKTTYDEAQKTYKSSLRKATNLLEDFEHVSGSAIKKLKYQIKLIEKKTFGRAAKELFDNMSLPSKHILQAMYNYQPLHNRANEYGRLKKYRKDKGERAIEDYLKSHRDKTNDDIATLVISDDRKAVKRISKMRKNTHNIIIALREEGLGMLLDHLSESTEFERPKKSDFSSSFKTMLELEDEKRFAKKAAQLITTGHYPKRGAGLSM